MTLELMKLKYSVNTRLLISNIEVFYLFTIYKNGKSVWFTSSMKFERIYVDSSDFLAFIISSGTSKGVLSRVLMSANVQ